MSSHKSYRLLPTREEYDEAIPEEDDEEDDFPVRPVPLLSCADETSFHTSQAKDDENTRSETEEHFRLTDHPVDNRFEELLRRALVVGGMERRRSPADTTRYSYDHHIPQPTHKSNTAQQQAMAGTTYLTLRDPIELESIPVLLEEDVDASNIMLRLYGQSVRKSGWWARSPFSADNGNLAIICLKILDAADFVLVWTDQVNESDSAEYQNHYKQREYFQAHLRNSGLTTHTVYSPTSPETKFVLIHAPFNVLLRVGESLHLKMPMARYHDGEKNLSEAILDKMNLSNPLKTPAYEGRERPFYRAAPLTDKTFKTFLGSDDVATFFRPSQRSSIVAHILERTFYSTKPGEVGLSQLLDNGAYTKGFPLHQGRPDGTNLKPCTSSSKENYISPRVELATSWASFSACFKYQPLHKVRDYFGERVAFYFTWVGFYTSFLVLAALAGLATFVYGTVTCNSDTAVQDICRGQQRMCPTCDKCKFWKLSDMCFTAKFSHVFDNDGTVLYGLFLCLWAAVFLELWKRKAAVTARHWNSDSHEEEEPVRAQYAAKAKSVAPNAVTGDLEPHLTQQTWPLYISVYMLLVLLLCTVVIWLLSLIAYRMLIAHISGEPFKSAASPLANFSASLINLVVVMVTRRVFSHVAVKLTEFETHRTDSEFSNHLSFKLFVFDCTSLFALPVYVAFFKGRFGGYPGHFSHGLFPYHGEQCGAYGCMLELAEAVMVLLVGKLVLDKVLDVMAWIGSLVSSAFKKKNNKNISAVYRGKLGRRRDSDRLSQYEEDLALPPPKALHWQYLEMVMQFAGIVLFGVAFPLAPFLALVNNVIEIRLDAMSYVKHTCRMVASLAQDIGIWYTLLDILAKLGVMTTALVLAFTSSFVSKLMYRLWHGGGSLNGFVHHTLSTAVVVDPSIHGNVTCHYFDYRDLHGNLTFEFWHLVTARLIFALMFEHLVFSAVIIMDWVVPDVPASLQEELARDVYKAKKTLEAHSAQEEASRAGSTRRSRRKTPSRILSLKRPISG